MMGASLKYYRTDMHVHTVLSPCASVEMIPPLIVQRAVQMGINWIAITDHNSTANIAAVMRAAAGHDLVITPGVELQSREDVHVLALFDSLEQVHDMQLIIDDHLPSIPNNIEFFGEQLIVDETGDFLAREECLLLSSLTQGFSDLARIVSSLGGLFIPAHVNRKAFGLLEILGFVPDSDPIHGLEISRHLTPQQAIENFPLIKDYPIIQNGDVHNLDDFLGCTYFKVASPTLTELRMALRHKNGRSFQVRSA